MTTAQHSVTIHALSAGSLTLPERFFVSPISDLDSRRTVPSLSFLIQHNTIGPPNRITRILFDLGIRRNLSRYSKPIRNHVETRRPLTTNPDVVASLAKGGLTPECIDIVILSHVHWDHVGMPTDFANGKTRFIIGNGALDLLIGKNKLKNGSHSHFEPDLLPLEQTIELPDPELSTALPTPPLSESGSESPGRLVPLTGMEHTTKEINLPSWQPFSLFPHTLDLFSDGSLYVINAPGHLPGHINILARVGTARWVYLAGDACHDIRLLTGEKEIAEWVEEDMGDGGIAKGKICCIHADKAAAEMTIERIKRLRGNCGENVGNGEGVFGLGMEDVEVIFAHDGVWEADARKRRRFWPGSL